MPEDLCQLVSMNYQGVELKNKTKVLPSFKNNLVIIFFESDGSVAGFKQEVKYSSDRWLKLWIDSADRFWVIQLIYLFQHFLLCLYSLFIALVNLCSELSDQLLFLLSLLFILLLTLFLFVSLFVKLLLEFLNLLFIEAFELCFFLLPFLPFLFALFLLLFFLLLILLLLLLKLPLLLS